MDHHRPEGLPDLGAAGYSGGEQESRWRVDLLIARSPIGDVLETSMGPWGLGTATYDRRRRYRYRLSRIWRPGGPRAVWIMLNPSTATAARPDPTITKVSAFTAHWGFAAAETVNLFALRATDPRRLRRDPDPVGPGNDDAIEAALDGADLVVAAWGVHGDLRGREGRVIAMLGRRGREVRTLGINRGGSPRHPLYLPSHTTPLPWRPPPTR